MKKKYTHIFFDLDHTLWDFEKNSNETLLELVRHFKISDIHSFDENQFLEKFHKANYILWDQFNADKISAEELRNMRFQMAFDHHLEDVKHLINEFNQAYINTCPHKGYLIPYAKEVLENLYSKYYKLFILTNGFEHIQLTKLITSNIFHYFDEVYSVKDIGFKKPNPEYFNFVLKEQNIDPSSCIMIGDSLEIDVLAAMNVGIDGVWYNPTNNYAPQSPTYIINDLRELFTIVDL